jgi:hypothetical protein
MRAECVDDAVKSETVGASRQIENVTQTLNRVAGRMLAGYGQGEFHRPGSPLMPLSASSLGISG